MADDFDYMEVDTPEFKGPGRKKTNLAAPIIMLVLAAALCGGVYYVVKTLGSRSASNQLEAPAGGISADDITKRQLSAFVEEFLLSYYNYSFTLYDQSVQKAESMMTPAFQTAYNGRAEDLNFKRKLMDLRVSTDGIRIIPGSMAFGHEGARWYVQLAGTMTFTTGINGVSGEFPLNLMVAVQKTDSGYLVDNVERLR